MIPGLDPRYGGDAPMGMNNGDLMRSALAERFGAVERGASRGAAERAASPAPRRAVVGPGPRVVSAGACRASSGVGPSPGTYVSVGLGSVARSARHSFSNARGLHFFFLVPPSQ